MVSTMLNEGKIVEINKVENFELGNNPSLNGSKGARLGFSGMVNAVFGGGRSMDGFEVVTDKHRFLVLIDNGQSCCEDWGYICSEDDTEYFIGSELREVRCTDTTLKQATLNKADPDGYGFDRGGIQFVDFVTNNGTFQLAVYNSHNGCYGHGIIVAKDDDILLNDTL